MRKWFMGCLLIQLGFLCGPNAIAISQPRSGASRVILRTHPPKKTWTFIEEEDGIRLYQHKVRGRKLPMYRVETSFRQPFWKVIRVLRDVTRHPEWVPNCVESRILSSKGFGHYRMYQRFDIPWPIWDRDIVLDVEGHKHGEMEARVVIRTVKNTSVRVPSHVVRIPRLRSIYRIKALNPHKTRISYDVDADLGGDLPDWLLRKIARDIPIETVESLKERLQHVSVPNRPPS